MESTCELVSQQGTRSFVPATWTQAEARHVSQEGLKSHHMDAACSMGTGSIQSSPLFPRPSGMQSGRQWIERQASWHDEVFMSSLFTRLVYFLVTIACISGNSGVTSYDINMEQQKVTVKGNVEPQTVLEKVSKTGKATSFWAA